MVELPRWKQLILQFFLLNRPVPFKRCFSVLEMVLLTYLSILSPGINFQCKRDGEEGGDGLLSSHDKTCHDCFCNNLIDQVMYHYSAPV